MSGFLAIPREVLDVTCREAWFPHDLPTAMVYAYLVNRANWCDGVAPLPRQLIPLKTGQLVLSERDLAEVFGMSRGWVRQRLARLELIKKISPLKSPQGTIIEICNYKEIFLSFDNEDTTKKPTSSPLQAHVEPTLSPIKTRKTIRQERQEGHPAEILPGGSAPPVTSAVPAPVLRTPGSLVWDAYREAYQSRYGHPPVRNAKSNALCAQLVSRVGSEAAVKVVAFYLSHQGSFYVQKIHPLSLCVADAEALHTQMLAGYRVSSAEARRVDERQEQAQVFQRVTDNLRAKGYV